MAEADGSAPTVQHYLLAPVKHPIKAARLLYTPAGFVLRGPVYMIFVIAFGALLYSFWAIVDQIVAAPLVLQRESNIVEAIGSGMVLEVSAASNAPIQFGDDMVTVQEQTRITADSEQAALESRQFEMRREMDRIESEAAAALAQIELDLEDMTTNRDTKKSGLEGRIKQIETQRNIAARTRKRVDDRLALAKKQFERTQKLFDSNDITITEYETGQSRVQELEKDVDDARAGIAKINVELATAKEELSSMLDLRRKDKLENQRQLTVDRRDRELKRLREELDSSAQKLISGQNLVEGVTFDENLTFYKSNYNGVVTDVHIRKGQMITPGTPLVTVVRETAVLEARALVSNEKIGHLKIGQSVKLKYYAYPYQEYGIPEGNITEIATKPGGVDGQESMYVIKVALQSENISKRGSKPKDLEIGLEGMAEVKTGEKRMIEILFSPVSRFFEGEEE